MDTLEIINVQIKKAVSINRDLVGLENVLTHINRAEHMLKIGQLNDDEHYFTDVIYRTNHAYEGILKEAYSLLAESPDEKATPYIIENYFRTENILKPRVLTLLESYRRDWRNTSTHDYNLFFDGGEAFLSILSVTAFIHVFLTQMLDKLYYDASISKLSPYIAKTKERYEKEFSSHTLVKKLEFLLETYDGNLYKQDENSSLSLLTEREYIQGITAHLKLVDSSLIVENEPEIGDNLRPDFIIEDVNGAKAVIELKIYKRWRESTLSQSEVSQLVTYLEKAKIKDGFLMFVPRQMNSEVVLGSAAGVVNVGNQTLNINLIAEQANDKVMNMEAFKHNKFILRDV